MEEVAAAETPDFSAIQTVAVKEGETLNFDAYGCKLFDKSTTSTITAAPINLKAYAWPDSIVKLGAYYVSHKNKGKCLPLFPLSVNKYLLEHARDVVTACNNEQGTHQLPSVIFEKTDSRFMYNARGNGYGCAFLVPLNAEGANVILFPHVPSDEWRDACQKSNPDGFHLTPALHKHLQKQEKHTVHVAQGQVLAVDFSMPFGFDKSINYQVHCVMFERPTAQQRRFSTWQDLIEAKGWFDICGKFKMDQMSGKLITSVPLEEVEKAVAVVPVVKADWLTVKPGGSEKVVKKKKAKVATTPPPPTGGADASPIAESPTPDVPTKKVVAPTQPPAGAGVGGFAARVSALLPGSLKPSTVKLLQSKATYNSKETEKLEKQISDAEAAQDALRAANEHMKEIVEQVPLLRVADDMKKLQISIDKLKKDFADLQEKIAKSCMLEKVKQVQDVYERLQALKGKIAEASAGKKGNKPKNSQASSVQWLEGTALEEFGIKVGESLAQKPNAALQAAFDEMLAKISEQMEKGEKVIYNVAKLQNILTPQAPRPAGGGAQKGKAANTAGLQGGSQKCHRKSGGCGNNVASLYKDQPVCLTCFLVHLKEKSQEVIKTVDEDDPMFDILANEYEKVYPTHVVPGKQTDPSKLHELVKQISQEEGVIPMEIDLNSNSNGGDDDDEDDEDEEDDSIVVDDDEVSYASSLEGEDEDEDEEDDAYETKRNKHGKRERDTGGVGESDKLHTIAHRILLARERTPIEARINELYDLHRKASFSGLDDAAKTKLITAAEVKLDELDALKSVYIIHASFGTKSMVNPFCFYSEEEAEAKCALLEKQTPGLKGRVEEKKL